MSCEKKNLLSDEEISSVSGGAKSDCVEMNGTVVEHLPNDIYKVQLENGDIIEAYRSGKLRMNYITLIVGDQVTVEFEPGSEHRGRVTYRFKRL